MSTTFRNRIAVWALCSIVPAAATLHADQLQMQNGDHYEGKVLSVTAESVVLQSDVLGKVTLPRNKVAQLIFGSGAATNSAAVVPHSPATTPAMQPATNIDLSGALSGLGADTNFIQQIRQQMLAGSGPQAGQKYDELVGGLMSGKLDVNDIRSQAQVSIGQIKDLKRELGPEADASLDAYLTILENFVNETAPATPSSPPVVSTPPVSPAPANFGTNKANTTLQAKPVR